MYHGDQERESGSSDEEEHVVGDDREEGRLEEEHDQDASHMSAHQHGMGAYGGGLSPMPSQPDLSGRHTRAGKEFR